MRTWMNRNECSSMYRFQFASLAFLCALYLPYVFHSTIWSFYTQTWTNEHCGNLSQSLTMNMFVNLTLESLSTMIVSQSDCCPCQQLAYHYRHDRSWLSSCHIWLEKISGLDRRKSNIIDEVRSRDNCSTCSFAFVFNSGN
jgi:hypothetical protein